MTELGIKNVNLGLSDHAEFSLVPIDLALGNWALTSAAIMNRDLKLALNFAEKWRDAAEAGGFEGELSRTKIVLQLFHLLLDKDDAPAGCSPEILTFTAQFPEEWKEAMRFISDWMDAKSKGTCAESRSFKEPYPLFLGIDLQKDGESEQDALDFKMLCKTRREYCHERFRSHLTVEDIERYADVMSQWELEKPLSDFLATLKTMEVDTYQQYTMARFLGKPVLERILDETARQSDVMRQEDAIILVLDVRKFSEMSEDLTPEETFNVLNPVFKILNEELEKAGGTVLEFAGDCLILVFNLFENRRSDISRILSHTIRCLQRIRILNTMASLQYGQPEIRIGVGIHKGPVAMGNLGGLKRCHMTILGNTVNLASRIESSTKDLPGDVIISESCLAGDAADIWIDPAGINYSIRDLGKHRMRNIKKPVRLYGFKPLLRSWIDFVPMGFVAHPERGVLYIDTGGSAQPGIIDLDFHDLKAHSSCELLLQKPELLRGHIRGVPESQIEFRLHYLPDLDCAATLYAAYELMDNHPRREVLSRLAAHVSWLCVGNLPSQETLSNSLYGIFMAHQKIVERHHGGGHTDIQLLEAGMRVVDAAVYAMEENKFGDFLDIFALCPEWFANERRLIDEDLSVYHEDISLRSRAYVARITGKGEPVAGIWLDHPRSVFYKTWARGDPDAPGGEGYRFVSTDLSKAGKNRFKFYAYPECEPNLEGLGRLLEDHETEKRRKMGKERPVHPIRYPADNSDPWYFGQGHEYTVIDAPWGGTILTADEARKIHESWT